MALQLFFFSATIQSDVEWCFRLPDILNLANDTFQQTDDLAVLATDLAEYMKGHFQHDAY